MYLTLRSFPIQHNIDFISGELSAQRTVEGPDRAIAGLLHLQGSHVEGVLALLMKFIVIDNGVFSSHDLGYRVREIDSLLESDITFQNGHLAVSIGQDQSPWMDRDGFFRSCCEVHQVSKDAFRPAYR